MRKESRRGAFRLPGRSAEGFAERLWMPLCHATKYLRVGISDGVWEIRKSWVGCRGEGVVSLGGFSAAAGRSMDVVDGE